MRAGATAAGAATHTAGFQLERLERTGDDTLEVAGRWFDIRGLRFMRPALELETPDGRHRLLAMLEHKPWEAVDGEEWVAAFPWDGDPVELTGAELAVAPSLSVALPLPRRARKSGKSKKSAQRKSSSEPRISARRVRPEPADNRALVEAQEVREERDEALDARDAAVRERDRAVAARDAAVRERDKAFHERGELARDRDAAMAAKSAALSKLESLMAEHDEALARRGAAVRAEESIRAQRDDARAAAEAARRERDAAIIERDSARRQLHDAQRECDELRKRVDAFQPVVPRVDQSANGADWRTRLPAVGALAILLVLVAAFIHGCG
jgi:hypothetical protein